VTRAMSALYFAATSGDSWSYQALPLWHAGMQYYGLFFFYIGFCLFVVMNSLTALFVDGVFEQAEKDRHMIVQDLLNKKSAFTNKLLTLFQELDADCSGEVSHSEFCGHLQDPRLRAFAESMDLEVNDLEQFFSILSNGGRNEIDLESFVIGCIKLRGNAKSIDLLDLMTSQRRVNNDLGKFMKQCKEDLAAVRGVTTYSAAAQMQQLHLLKARSLALSMTSASEVAGAKEEHLDLQPRSMSRKFPPERSRIIPERGRGASRGLRSIQNTLNLPMPATPVLYRNLVDQTDRGGLLVDGNADVAPASFAAPHHKERGIQGHRVKDGPTEISVTEVRKDPCCVLRT